MSRSVARATNPLRAAIPPPHLDPSHTPKSRHSIHAHTTHYPRSTSERDMLFGGLATLILDSFIHNVNTERDGEASIEHRHREAIPKIGTLYINICNLCKKSKHRTSKEWSQKVEKARVRAKIPEERKERVIRLQGNGM